VEINNKSVVFIPSYTETVLTANGISLDQLELTMLTKDDNSIRNMFSKLSAYDLAELYVANAELNKILFNIVDYSNNMDLINYGIYSYLYDRIDMSVSNLNIMLKDMINNLSSSGTILVSEESYSFKIYEQTIFVILHNNFSDIIVSRDKEKIIAFNKKLVDVIFKSFGEKEALKHPYIKSYVSVNR